MRSHRPAIALFAFSLLLGCEETATQLIVRVDSDLVPPSQVAEVRVQVTDPTEEGSGEEPEVHPLQVLEGTGVPGEGQVVLPFSFGVTPGAGGAGSEALIRLDAVHPTAGVIVTATARAAFVEHQALLLPMFLWRDCQGLQCSEGETCDLSEGELVCVPELRVGLRPVNPGAELDGGAPTDGGPPPAARGELDPTFGTMGVRTHDYVNESGASKNDQATGVAIDSGGRIVVSASGTHNDTAGASDTDDMAALTLRLRPDGSLDPSFGSGGWVAESPTRWAHAQSVVLDEDRPVVCGFQEWDLIDDPTVYRYRELDGSRDADFGSGGVTRVPLGGEVQCLGLAVDPRGNYVLTGGQQENRMILARVLASSGEPDPTFASGGTLQYANAGTYVMGSGVVVDEAGLIYVAGYIEEDLAVWRVEDDGTLDESYADRGIFRLPGGHAVRRPGLRPYETRKAAALDRGGRLIVVGHDGPVDDRNLLVIRLLPDGSLDAAFGEDGVFRFDSGSMDQAFGVAVDGRSIYVAGQLGTRMALWRLTPAGTLDAGFGGTGESSTPGVFLTSGAAGGAWDVARDLAVDAEGRIVVVGESATGDGHTDIAVWRVR